MIRFERLGWVVGWAMVFGPVGGGTIHAQGPESKPRAEATWPGLTRAGTVILPNGWSLKPAGRQVKLGDFPVSIAEHPTEPVLAVLHAGYGEHEVVTLDATSGKVIARVALKESFQGLAWSGDGKRLLVGGGWDDVIYRFDHSGGLLSNKFEFKYPSKIPGQRVPAGLAVSEDGNSFVVANLLGHSLSSFVKGEMEGELPLGVDSFPYAVVVHGGRAYVSLWNKAEVAVVDVSTNELRVVARWATQEHPNEMLLAKAGKVLYVANANRNTVTVFDTELGKAIETIGTAIDPNAPPGSTPSSLALTPDEEILFVANANTNDVAVFNVKESGESKPLGFIPAGWYPTSVRVARKGTNLYIANGKGTSSKANREGPNPLAEGVRNNVREYIGGLFQGSMSILPIPGPKEMLAYSKTVYECSPLRARATEGTPTRPPGHPIPAKVGDPSPIKHVIYIVKENRTYDQVFGDLPEGNGEKALCLFPEDVTPNHHALAREFVLLDNFYAEAEVSADGHEWSMGAYATDFVERTWPLSYRGDRRVPYPSEGALALGRPANGYLWDRAAAKGLTYRSYGEFIENGKPAGAPSTTKVEALKGHFDPGFRGYDLSYPDVKRADRFLEEVAGFEKSGDLPNLVILRLPNDHTAGTRPGGLTVSAMVADNDLALGRVVEGLSKSRFWPNLAIFVVEDDAQNGSDHVDAHRTVALAIGPHIKKHSVDSTMYSTSSMVRTMGLILGLEPLSQFDAAARPMADSFTPTADLAPYAARPARIDLDARNARDAFGAEVSMELDLDEAEDRADDLVFNEIIWKAVKGKDSPMPPPVRSAFVLPRKK